MGTNGQLLINNVDKGYALYLPYRQQYFGYDINDECFRWDSVGLTSIIIPEDYFQADPTIEEAIEWCRTNTTGVSDVAAIADKITLRYVAREVKFTIYEDLKPKCAETVRPTLTLDDMVHFTWGFGMYFLLTLIRDGREWYWTWSDPDYGGNNTIRPYTNNPRDFTHKDFAGRCKGENVIRTKCGDNVEILVD